MRHRSNRTDDADQQSVESLFERDHQRLWRSLLAFTGDAEIASDAESEAYAQAIRRGPAIKNLPGWIWTSSFRIASGLMQDRQKTSNIDGIDVPDEASAEGMLDLLWLLQQLSNQQRACVILVDFGGFKAADAASVLGTSAQTVRVQLHRARTQMRQELRKANQS